MKKLNLFGLLTLTLLTVGCAAKTTSLDHSNGQAVTARIELPRHITALYVNSEEITLPFMMSYPYFLQVAEGPVTLKFVYAQDWGRNNRTTERVKSNIMTLDFKAEAENHYVIDFEKPLSTSDPDNAYPYIQNFQAWVHNGGDKITTADNSGKSPNGLGVLAQLKTVSAPGGQLAELKRLWKAANADEKKAFMNWVIAPVE